MSKLTISIDSRKRYRITEDSIMPAIVEFPTVVKEEDCKEQGIEFVDHNKFARWQIDWVVEKDIPGDFAFDSYFTCAANLNHIHGYGRRYVGDLKFNRKIIFKGKKLKAEELAGQISPNDRKPIMLNGSRQYYFTKTIRIPDVNHKVRIVIVWDNRKDKNAKKILVCNRIHWEVTRILRVYRCRWRGTECFHRDGKGHLGMGDCQLGKGRGQTRHMYMAFLAHSVLMRQLRQGCAREWAQERLTTIGQACMSVLRQTLSDTISWVIERIEDDGWNFERIKVQLALPQFCKGSVI